MVYDDDAIPGAVYVQLDSIGAVLERLEKRRDGIFPATSRRAAMADDLDAAGG